MGTAKVCFAFQYALPESKDCSGKSAPGNRLLRCSLLSLLVLPLIFLVWPDLVPVSFLEASGAAPAEPADAIVFLGGNWYDRERKSLGLLQEGMGRFLLVTGENPYATNRIRALLPPDKWVVEPAATSTWENAQFSYPLLRERGVQSAILVTDWWHTRRALACFRRACPDIRLSVVPAAPLRMERPFNIVSADSRRRECLARLWYAARYAIW